MFTPEHFLAVLWSVTGGLLTLLGSTGVFVSLVVQRRIERLQDILEEFLELPYLENKNLAGPMVNLVRKYQMHYLFPDGPGKTILFCLDFTLSLIGLIWLYVLFYAVHWPIRPIFGVQLLLLILIAGNILLFRRLLQHTINPTGTSLFNPIIPPPYLLRSVSYLSRYVNVSVKSVLQQARFAIVITPQGELRLKQELSFDDFYYLLYCPSIEFKAWGELRLHFPSDPITKKPIPMQRNIEIPLGKLSIDLIRKQSLNAILFVFPQGEKHPIQYDFELENEDGGYHSIPFPKITVQSSIVFQVQNHQLIILEGSDNLPYFAQYRNSWLWNGERYYSEKPAGIAPCRCNLPPEIC